MIPTLAFSLAALAAAAATGAQTPSDDSARSRGVRQAGGPASPSTDSLFRRAERLVRDGRGESGRALVDTLLAATRAGTPQHGQALYWRASLASDAAEAERGYRRVIVEYPATRWAGDAMLNLAQLEMARGEQDQALVHLHRFDREHPTHESRARASLWLARLHFDRKNDARGCAALATARVTASPEDVELRNQIDYYGQRCIGVDTSTAAPPAPRVAAPAPAVDASPSTPARASTAAPTSPTIDTPTVPPTPPVTPRETPTRDSARVTPPVAAPATPPVTAARAPTTGGYTLQVAAYDSRSAAEALIERLKARGYTARLATTARPFRVRIGRYESRPEAVAALQQLRAKGIDGFVAEMEKP